MGERLTLADAAPGVEVNVRRQPRASIVIPTLASRPELERAIASVLAQSVPTQPIVVVNGGRADPAILARLRERDDITLIESSEPGSPAARLRGRHAATTPFFGFLDDDDELLPEAVATFLDDFPADADAVVCNFWIDRGAGRARLLDLPGSPAEAEAATLTTCWLYMGAVLYRAATTPERLFADLPIHCHITLMALRMSRDMRLHFNDVPVVVRHMGAAGQASLSERYLNIVPEAMRQAEREATRPEIRAGLRRKRAAALHELSDHYRAVRAPSKAWRSHLRSLAAGGARYAAFTSRLLALTLSRAAPLRKIDAPTPS